MRVCLFGGSFDPPHAGHVAIARAAADRFELGRVLFAPVGRQPLKAKPAHASFADRLAMVELACAADTRFRASLLDEPRPDGEPNYTSATLERLHAELGADADVFALAGADSFLTLGHWREPHRLLALAQWIVVTRPGSAWPEPLAPEGMQLSAAEQRRVHRLDSVHLDLAATALRLRLAQLAPCSGLLPAGVERYIVAHGLYGANSARNSGADPLG